MWSDLLRVIQLTGGYPRLDAPIPSLTYFLRHVLMIQNTFFWLEKYDMSATVWRLERTHTRAYEWRQGTSSARGWGTRAKSHLAFELPLNSCLCPCVPLTPVRGLPRAVLLPRPSVFAIKSSELSGPNYWNRRWEGHLENPGSAGLSQAQGLLLPKPFAYSWCWDKGPPASSLPSPFSTQGAVPPGAPVPGERTRITKCMC